MAKEDNIKTRNRNVDVLKAVCAFLVVCIHAGFSGKLGEYILLFARVAVPVFYMITGYYYRENRKRKQIVRIIVLIVQANLLYCFLKIVLALFTRHGIVTYMESIVNLPNLWKLLVFNVSPFSGPLWYLNALLYVLLLYGLLIDKYEIEKFEIHIVGVLLIVGLVLGKYSFLIKMTFPSEVSRNAYFVGFPFFLIGRFMARHISASVDAKKVLIVLPIISVFYVIEKTLLNTITVKTNGDIYVHTIILAVAIFAFAVISPECEKSRLVSLISTIGKRYSAWIFILHTGISEVLSVVAEKVGGVRIYLSLRPIIVFMFTIISIQIWQLLSNQYRRLLAR